MMSWIYRHHEINVVILDVLQVGDRLLSAFGQDTIDALFWTATERHGRKREHVLTFTYHSLWALVYVFCHTVLVLLQATTLNVAINASNKALLTIMMSNNVSPFPLLCSLRHLQQ